MILTYLIEADDEPKRNVITSIEVDFNNYQQIKDKVQYVEYILHNDTGSIEHTHRLQGNKFVRWSPPLWEQIYQRGSRFIKAVNTAVMENRV